MALNNLNDLDFANRKYDGWKQVEATVTYDGGTTNAIGDFNGTGEPHTIFTVTGTCHVKMFAVCETTLTIDAAATAEVGTTATTAGLIAQTAGDAIDVNEIWHDATPDASVELTSVIQENIVSDDIISTTATANILTGVIRYICLWKPFSFDGNVVAA
jgi:hypothetical protein